MLICMDSHSLETSHRCSPREHVDVFTGEPKQMGAAPESLYAAFGKIPCYCEDCALLSKREV